MTDKLPIVCCFLGPHRSLSTLLASILALHPNCEGVNHGSDVLFPSVPDGVDAGQEFPSEMSWLMNYSEDKFIEFTQRLLKLADTKGIMGNIEHAHAWARVAEKVPESIEPGETNCIVWKDGKRFSNLVRSYSIDLAYVIEHCDRIRFLTSIRNICDTAGSYLAGHGSLYSFMELYSHAKSEEIPLRSVLKIILTEVDWILQLGEQHPDRFFYVTEDGFNLSTARKLAVFLKLPEDEGWNRVAVDCWDISHQFGYFIRQERKNLQDVFQEFPRVLALGEKICS